MKRIMSKPKLNEIRNAQYNGTLSQGKALAVVGYLMTVYREVNINLEIIGSWFDHTDSGYVHIRYEIVNRYGSDTDRLISNQLGVIVYKPKSKVELDYLCSLSRNEID